VSGQGLCNPTGKAAAENENYVAHIRQIVEEKCDAQGRKKHPARRWVVERAGAWLSKCRAILVWYNKEVIELPGPDSIGHQPPVVSSGGPTWAAYLSRRCFEIVS
jgi:hypothetical protein